MYQECLALGTKELYKFQSMSVVLYELRFTKPRLLTVGVEGPAAQVRDGRQRGDMTCLTGEDPSSLLALKFLLSLPLLSSPPFSFLALFLVSLLCSQGSLDLEQNPLFQSLCGRLSAHLHHHQAALHALP